MCMCVSRPLRERDSTGFLFFQIAALAPSFAALVSLCPPPYSFNPFWFALCVSNSSAPTQPPIARLFTSRSATRFLYFRTFIVSSFLNPPPIFRRYELAVKMSTRIIFIYLVSNLRLIPWQQMNTRQRDYLSAMHLTQCKRCDTGSPSTGPAPLSLC